MHGKHLVNHIHHSDKMKNDNTLHVVRVISNPVRYHSRYRLARKQEEFLKTCPNIKLYTVEAAFGDRHHELIQESHNHLKLKIRSEIWIKENMINLGVRHLFPSDWKYMAWIDGDVIWNDQNWAMEAIHQLQHYPVIQPWTDGLDLGNYGNILSHFKSFGSQNYHQFDHELSCKMKGVPVGRVSRGVTAASSMPDSDYRRYGHTGYAWACTRYFWENIGGLMDFCILGSADHNMALAMVGNVDFSINKHMSKGFFQKCHDWQTKATRVTHKNVGATHDRLEHFFHGPKKRRYYTERWKILTHFKFDPIKDLMYDDQGVIHLTGKPGLEQAIRHYNRSRHEDDICEM